MVKSRLLAASAVSVLAFGIAMPASAQSGGAAAPAVVQDQNSDDDAQAPDIVVTGSLIKGTPEDAALPVDVISGEELA